MSQHDSDHHDAATGLLVQRPPAWRSPCAWVVLLVVLTLGLSLDLISKTWAFNNVADQPVMLDRPTIVKHPNWQPPRHEPIVVLDRVLNIRLVLNPGAVFGIGPGQRWFFIFFTLSAMAVGLLLFSFRSRAGDHIIHLAIGCILAGAGGNLFDRIMIGAVRDFLNMFPGIPLPFDWHWHGGSPELFPWVFNVADMLLLIGIGLLIFRINCPASRTTSTG